MASCSLVADRAEGPVLDRGTVLQVVTSTARRGAEVFATQLGEALDDRSWAVETVALWPGSGAGTLDLVTLGRRRRDPTALRVLQRRARAASVVVGHGSSTLPFGALATRAASRSRSSATPFVYRSIGDPSFWGSSRARRLRVGAALRRAAAVVALWPAAADVIADRYGVDRRAIHVIPTAVPAAGFSPTAPEARVEARGALAASGVPGLDPDRPTLLLLGALSEEKNPIVAIEVMASLPDAQLLVAGSGPLSGPCAERARQMASGRVHLLGSVAEPARILAAADVLLLPSHTEGIPAVAIEAALSGIPVVASRVGGIPHLVVDDETGVLIDDPTPFRLARAVERALRDGVELGAAARSRALGRFTIDVVGDAWSALLDDVVSGGNGRGH
jgi:glycosyltransferase involved in cell wall biosynthesis